MHASDDFYFLRFEHRPLTPEQWDHLKRSVVRRAKENRARILRSLFVAILTLLRRAATGGRDVARAFGRRTAAAARRRWCSHAAWRVRRRAIKELRGLDDRVLKDMGLHRCEIESVVVYGRDSGPVAEGKVAASPCPKPYASRRIATKGARSQLMQKNAA